MQIFRYRDGIAPNSFAFVYVLVGYPVSIYGLTTGNVLWYVAAILLLAHSLVIAAYLLHECIHQTIFKNSKHNEWLGMLLAWITGACYSDYLLLKKKHLRHHANRVDSLAIDMQTFFREHEFIYKAVGMLEWLYIPAIELLTHILAMLSPFFLPSRREQRGRVITILILRLVFFSALAAWHWAILPAYAIAYLLFLRVLGFMDAFQHIYEVRLNLDEENNTQEFDRDYEEKHTWSNLLSEKHEWLNLVVLNFCYHNVHHYRPGEPWYRLPRLHAAKYPANQPNLAVKEQLLDFHRYRSQRLLQTHNDDVNYGAAGVSFLAGI